LNHQRQLKHETVPDGAARRVVRWIAASASRARGKVGATIAGTGRVEALDYPNAEILIRVRSQQERVRSRSVAKEPWTVDWIETWLQPDQVLYDIGANVGAYSLIAAKRPGGAAQVLAFEPGYASFAALCDNILLNGVEERIEPLPICLADRTGRGVFRYGGLEPGGVASSVSAQGAEDGSRPAYRQPVLSFSLDDLIQRFSLPNPEHIKLDVDGSELAILQGGSATLARPELRSLMVEIDDGDADGLVGLLADRGFELRERFRRRDAGTLATHSYGLFARESR
jgi:FkbM family methyltransferase